MIGTSSGNQRRDIRHGDSGPHRDEIPAARSCRIAVQGTDTTNFHAAMKSIRTMPLLPVLLALFTMQLCGQVPRQISYQGVLTDASGTPIPDGNHTLTVKLYDPSGAELHAETHTVPVVRGTFNLIIGSVTPLPPSLTFDQQYQLGIAVDNGGELSPRVPFTAAPYALRAATASSLALPFSGTADGSRTALSITASGTAGAGFFRSTSATPAASALVGESSAKTPTALMAGIEGRSGVGIGVLGSGGTASTAVYGLVTTTSTTGEFLAGTGVSGFSNVSNGVGGVTHNASGAGVFGSAIGNGIGVRGTSSDGRAGFFELTTPSNPNTALEGITNGSGIGVRGANTAMNGLGTGVLGEASSSAAGAGVESGVSGVLGRVASSAPGKFSAGVRGLNNGTTASGAGVLGFQAGSGHGVYGETPEGTGVYGVGTSTSASAVGVRGETFSPEGAAVEARYGGKGTGTALVIDNGAIKVTGPTRAAFVHIATPATKRSPNGTDIDHPLCNDDPNAILLVTLRVHPPGGIYNNSSIGVSYNTVRSRWEIVNQNNTPIPDNTQFNVLVIKQ